MPKLTLYLSNVKTHQFAIDTDNKTVTVLYHFDSPFTNRLVKPSHFTYSGLEKTFNHYMGYHNKSLADLLFEIKHIGFSAPMQHNLKVVLTDDET